MVWAHSDCHVEFFRKKRGATLIWKLQNWLFKAPQNVAQCWVLECSDRELMCTMGLNTKSVWLSPHTDVSSCGGALRFYKSFRKKYWSLFFFKVNAFSSIFLSAKPRGLVQGSGCMYYDLHSYEVADGRRQFSTNLFGFCIKKYSFRVIVQVALHPAKINISLFIFPQAFKGQVWGVKCHSKLISSTHKHKNKGATVSLFT